MLVSFKQRLMSDNGSGKLGMVAGMPFASSLMLEA